MVEISSICRSELGSALALTSSLKDEITALKQKRFDSCGDMGKPNNYKPSHSH